MSKLLPRRALRSRRPQLIHCSPNPNYQPTNSWLSQKTCHLLRGIEVGFCWTPIRFRSTMIPTTLCELWGCTAWHHGWTQCWGWGWPTKISDAFSSIRKQRLYSRDCTAIRNWSISSAIGRKGRWSRDCNFSFNSEKFACTKCILLSYACLYLRLLCNIWIWRLRGTPRKICCFPRLPCVGVGGSDGSPSDHDFWLNVVMLFVQNANN